MLDELFVVLPVELELCVQLAVPPFTVVQLYFTVVGVEAVAVVVLVLVATEL